MNLDSINPPKAKGPSFRYSAAIFYVDPEAFGQLPEIMQFTDALLFNLDRAGMAVLRAFLLDSDLQRAAEPLEQTLVFLRVLYPIAIGLSVAVGLISCLCGHPK